MRPSTVSLRRAIVLSSLLVLSPPPALSAEVLTAVPMQGPMVHVNIIHRRVGDAPHISVHVDPSIPVLLPLRVSNPGATFDPAHPWHEELDPGAGGAAFNRQYGLVLDGQSDPLSEGHTIRVVQLTATSGLLVRRYRQNPPTWEPMFGQSGSAPEFEWNLMMFHPAYAIDPEATGPVQAEYEVRVVDSAGQVVGTPGRFDLAWQVAPVLRILPPRLAGTMVGIPAVVPEAWQGWRLELERSTALVGGPWGIVDTMAAAVAATNVLSDPEPPTGPAFYRARVTAP